MIIKVRTTITFKHVKDKNNDICAHGVSKIVIELVMTFGPLEANVFNCFVALITSPAEKMTSW